MKKKILIVEDNPDLIYILRSQLQNRGYDTMLAVNVKEAVDMAASQKPDLILMDMMMPVMNGLRATRMIRKNPKTRSIPVITVTALTSSKEMEECFQSGCNDYICKPFTAEQLVTRIEKLLKQNST